jgi:DNA-binding winged helix-turn-helix (wHTH) protein
MSSHLPTTYLLGDFRLEADKLLLSRLDRPIHLARRPFLVLLYLIEHRDQVVSRAELLDRFWDGKDVAQEMRR